MKTSLLVLVIILAVGVHSRLDSRYGIELPYNPFEMESRAMLREAGVDHSDRDFVLRPRSMPVNADMYRDHPHFTSNLKYEGQVAQHALSLAAMQGVVDVKRCHLSDKQQTIVFSDKAQADLIHERSNLFGMATLLASGDFYCLSDDEKSLVPFYLWVHSADDVVKTKEGTYELTLRGEPASFEHFFDELKMDFDLLPREDDINPHIDGVAMRHGNENFTMTPEEAAKITGERAWWGWSGGVDGLGYNYKNGGANRESISLYSRTFRQRKGRYVTTATFDLTCEKCYVHIKVGVSFHVHFSAGISWFFRPWFKMHSYHLSASLSEAARMELQAAATLTTTATFEGRILSVWGPTLTVFISGIPIGFRPGLAVDWEVEATLSGTVSASAGFTQTFKIERGVRGRGRRTWQTNNAPSTSFRFIPPSLTVRASGSLKLTLSPVPRVQVSAFRIVTLDLEVRAKPYILGELTFPQRSCTQTRAAYELYFGIDAELWAGNLAVVGYSLDRYVGLPRSFSFTILGQRKLRPSCSFCGGCIGRGSFRSAPRGILELGDGREEEYGTVYYVEGDREWTSLEGYEGSLSHSRKHQMSQRATGNCFNASSCGACVASGDNCAFCSGVGQAGPMCIDYTNITGGSWTNSITDLGGIQCSEYWRAIDCSGSPPTQPFSITGFNGPSSTGFCVANETCTVTWNLALPSNVNLSVLLSFDPNITSSNVGSKISSADIGFGIGEAAPPPPGGPFEFIPSFALAARIAAGDTVSLVVVGQNPSEEEAQYALKYGINVTYPGGAPPPTVPDEWVYSDLSVCRIPCGISYRERKAVCISGATGLPLNDNSTCGSHSVPLVEVCINPACPPEVVDFHLPRDGEELLGAIRKDDFSSGRVEGKANSAPENVVVEWAGGRADANCTITLECESDSSVPPLPVAVVPCSNDRYSWDMSKSNAKPCLRGHLVVKDTTNPAENGTARSGPVVIAAAATYAVTVNMGDSCEGSIDVLVLGMSGSLKFGLKDLKKGSNSVDYPATVASILPITGIEVATADESCVDAKVTTVEVRGSDGALGKFGVYGPLSARSVAALPDQVVFSLHTNETVTEEKVPRTTECTEGYEGCAYRASCNDNLEETLCTNTHGCEWTGSSCDTSDKNMLFGSASHVASFLAVLF